MTCEANFCELLDLFDKLLFDKLFFVYICSNEDTSFLIALGSDSVEDAFDTESVNLKNRSRTKSLASTVSASGASVGFGMQSSSALERLDNLIKACLSDVLIILGNYAISDDEFIGNLINQS